MDLMRDDLDLISQHHQIQRGNVSMRLVVIEENPKYMTVYVSSIESLVC